VKTHPLQVLQQENSWNLQMTPAASVAAAHDM
jgi:hypothetical protein